MRVVKDRLAEDLGNDLFTYVEVPGAAHDFFLMIWHEPERTQTLQMLSEWIPTIGFARLMSVRCPRFYLPYIHKATGLFVGLADDRGAPGLQVRVGLSNSRIDMGARPDLSCVVRIVLVA